MTKVSDRLLISIIIMSLFGIVLSTLGNNSDSIVPVFNEYDSNKTYIVDVSKRYESIVDSGWYNIDETINFNKNIDNINRYYKNIFDNNKLNIEALDIDINGVGISKIKVVTESINKYSKYKVEKVNFE